MLLHLCRIRFLLKILAFFNSLMTKNLNINITKPEPFTLSIDWEDFGQVSALAIDGILTSPKKAIERQTDIILSMLDDTNVKATFFILGMLADARPDLLKKIANEGHEIALHGMNHTAMFKLTEKQAFQDINDSKNLVSDITGQEIFGYRAPSFSILKENLYILDILYDLGFTYDSSIMPVKMPRYGIENFNTEAELYSLPRGGEIVELPLAIKEFGWRKWPISGGGYMRLMPKSIMHKIYSNFSEKNSDCMIYMHPYEFDTDKIDITQNLKNNQSLSTTKTLYLNFRWNFLRQSIRPKIKYLLQNYSFSTAQEKAHYVKITTNSPTILG